MDRRPGTAVLCLLDRDFRLVAGALDLRDGIGDSTNRACLERFPPKLGDLRCSAGVEKSFRFIPIAVGDVGW